MTSTDWIAMTSLIVAISSLVLQAIQTTPFFKAWQPRTQKVVRNTSLMLCIAIASYMLGVFFPLTFNDRGATAAFDKQISSSPQFNGSVKQLTRMNRSTPEIEDADTSFERLATDPIMDHPDDGLSQGTSQNGFDYPQTSNRRSTSSEDSWGFLDQSPSVGLSHRKPFNMPQTVYPSSKKQSTQICDALESRRSKARTQHERMTISRKMKMKLC